MSVIRKLLNIMGLSCSLTVGIMLVGGSIAQPLLQSSINSNDLSGNVACLPRSQEYYQRRYFFGHAKAPQRNFRKQSFLLFLYVLRRHGTRNHTRADGVDPDVERSHFARQRPGERDDATFGGRIIALAGLAANSAGRHDIADRPAPPPHHARQG